MHQLTTDQFFALADVNQGTFKAAVSRGHAALAFGADRKLAGGILLDLDAVSWRLIDELTPAFTREVAAMLVRNFSDKWCAAVAKADSGEEPVFLLVIEVGETRGSKMRAIRDIGINVDFGTLPEIGAFDHRVAKTIPDRMTLINISSLLARTRRRAAEIGIDLSAPLLPPLDDPEFERVLAETRAAREKHARPSASEGGHK